ncbi:MAG: DUF115 domain-containing protein [Sphaerochaeta sp.]|uniref:DUF115 domain-containing protein n=1 Tax=Sphaerochaeta sp. TaxID=1972642 RepID=UPI002FCA59AA
MRTSLVMVGVSFVLSRLMLGNFLFTIPLMVLAPKFSDRKTALLPVGLVAVLIGLTELIRSKGAFTSPEGRILLLIGLFIPTVLLVASAVWIAFPTQRTVYRYLASCLFGVAASFAVVIWFSKPNETLMRVDSALLETFRLILGQASGNNQATLGISDSAIRELYRLSVMTVGAILAPVCMALVGFASFIAMSYQSRLDKGFNNRVARWKIPEVNLWIFLGAWTIVLLLIILKAPYLYRALAMQVAFGSSVLYAVQGMAIVTHFVLRKGLTVSPSRLFTTVFLLAFLIPGVNLLVVFALPLLGVTETWIAYRSYE